MQLSWHHDEFTNTIETQLNLTLWSAQMNTFLVNATLIMVNSKPYYYLRQYGLFYKNKEKKCAHD